MSNENPFFSSIAFTFRNRYYFFTRETNVFAFLLCYGLIQPYKLLQAGWHLSLEPAPWRNPKRKGFFVRVYRAVRHVVTWIQSDIKSYRKWQVTDG